MDSTTLDPSTLDQSSLQNMLGGSNASIIPESLATTLTVGFIVLNVLSILFVVFYIINAVRKWKVQSAILHLQKDVSEIKGQLANLQPTPAPAAEPVVAPTSAPIEPALQNRVIADNTTESTSDSRLS